MRSVHLKEFLAVVRFPKCGNLPEARVALARADSFFMFRLDPQMELHSWRKYSQNDEDGILRYLFSVLPPTPTGPFFVEFGIGPRWQSTLAETGLEGNCRLLREMGWKGLFLDSETYPPEYAVAQERIDAININSILRKYRVPEKFDVISIDVDGQDFWIWSNLIYCPTVVIIEYNASLPIVDSKVVPFDASFRWDGTNWYGASLRALFYLGNSKGYTLVYANGVNAFFVRGELVKNKADFPFEQLYRFRELHAPDVLKRPWVVIPTAASEAR